tara:strand:- start:114 stop:236 length:123 start_codon:yes stop_codon:yes gene_type:complete
VVEEEEQDKIQVVLELMEDQVVVEVLHLVLQQGVLVIHLQ